MFRFVQTGKKKKTFEQQKNTNVYFSFFFTVISRTNLLFSQNVAASHNIVRNIGAERGFGAPCKVSAQTLYALNAIKPFKAPQITQSIASNIVPSRTVTNYTSSGKRATVGAAVARFFRLHWGGWIRTRCGRHKKMWKKSSNRKHRLRQHVLVNAQQSHLLDKMVTKFWKRPKYYIDDIYEPYHDRTFYLARRQPMPCPSKPLKQYKPIFELSKQFD